MKFPGRGELMKKEWAKQGTHKPCVLKGSWKKKRCSWSQRRLETEARTQPSSRGAELPRGDWSLRGGDAWVPGRRLAKRAAHHRPLLPGPPRKPARVGEGLGGDSGNSGPSPQRDSRKGGRELGGQPPTIPTAMGPASHSHLPSIGRG